MEPFRSHMHLTLVQQSMKKTIDGVHLEKKEAKMDTIEGSMKVAMALNYLREKASERRNVSDKPTRQPVLLLSTQIMGRALMIVGREVQVVGMRLVKFGQRETS
jgi:hypothetical protein